ncbi:MAG: hypothetical protein K0R52_92 [Alphaproteobacteria bacterium]|jgi:uncharacterized protein YecE (DUF72 family)|nr:hypothetical protein [Alphaproteobacteria bacterium]
MIKQKARIGCSGWSYKEWKGLFYPEKMPPAKYLPHYTQFFNTVEVNTTFYRHPSSQMVQRWYQNAPKGFKYSLKVNKQITHVKKLKHIREDLDLLYSLRDILKEKMGCFLFQFPKSFIFSEERLDQLISALDPAYENVVEFRHASWWNEQTFEALAEVNSTFCTVSGLDVPEDLIILKGRVYIRLHGDPSYAAPYADEELFGWKQKIEDASVNHLWIYFNNTRQGCAPENALRLAQMIHE